MNIHKEFLKNIRKEEAKRQFIGVELIASENYVSEDVLKMNGSEFTNKYAEGNVGKRYYGGCEEVDKVETYTINLAKKIFRTDYEVNVQPHSGSSANMGVYYAVLRHGDTVLGMSLSAGGHLTHGAKPSFSGKKYGIYNSISYGLDKNGYIDYKQVRELALKHKPKLIIAGASAYSRIIDWNKFKEIADEVGAYLMTDIAHIAGLIVAQEHPSPFGIADFVTTTTHKTLRGPRGGVIFSKTEELGKLINSAIFPGIQGGPDMSKVAAKGICFAEATTKEYEEYIRQVVRNAKEFEHIFNEAEFLIEGEIKKIKIVSNGTDNHLLLLDFSDLKISGAEVEELLGKVHITTNKNSVPGDTKPNNPSGIRIGTPAITSRGIDENMIRIIGEIMINTINIYLLKDEELLKETIDKNAKVIEILMTEYPIYPKI